MTITSKAKSDGVLVVLLALLIAGCAVGPNYRRPPAPTVSGYTADAVTNTAAITNIAGGEGQRFVPGADLSAQWWTLFHSQALNDLVARALKANPNIKAAQASLLAARESVRSQRGAYYPSVDASFAASRNKSPEQLSSVPNQQIFYYSLFTPEVAVSYTPDVFGLNRRTVESLNAQAQQQRFSLIATYITLSANVVSAAVNEAALRGQIAATRQLVDQNNKALDVLRAQFAKGYASRLDLAAQESQVAQIAATLPPLLKQLAQQRDALAVLVGAFPSEDPAEKFELANLHLPEDLPLSLPAKLVEQRPDIRQAEENMHAASAQVGISIANRIPNITLSANAGSTALAIDQLFSSGTGFWSLGAAVSQPIFQGGMLLHKERAAKAAYVEASEQYRAVVLAAFQNVADTLNALEQDGNALKAAVEAEHAAKVTFDLTQKQLQSGYINYLTLVSAETVYQQAVMALVQAQANRYADTAALFLALGGGWWNQGDLSKN